MKEPVKIYIQWADATSPSNHQWWELDEAIAWAENDSYWIEQIGWLLKETDKYILMAANKSTTKSGDYIIQYGEIQKIPKTWIRKRKIIKI